MISSLQYLRGVAALMVVWFHCGAQVARSGAQPLPLHDVGEYGVDVFFVISGVVMWVTTAGRGLSPVEFLRRRVERVAPLYWIVTLVVAGVAFVAPDVMRSTVFEPSHFVASLLFIPWPNPVDGGLTPILVPGWTLNYEMYFYFLFALALATPLKIRLPIVLAALALGVAAGLGAPAESLRDFYGNPMLLEFGAGALIGALLRGGVVLPPPAALTIAAASLPLALVLWRVPDAPRALHAGLPAALLTGGLVFAERGGRGVRSVWALRIGDASYSIYLTHPLTLAAVSAVWRPLGLSQAAAYYVVAMAAALAIGLATYRFAERPISLRLHARRAGAHGQAAAHL